MSPQEPPRDIDSDYREMVDLAGLRGMYVTQNFESPDLGVRMWCGYCCTPLHYDHRHLGTEPFLTLMVRMADIHRAFQCPEPKGPFRSDWHPSSHPEWHRMQKKRYKESE